MRSVHTIYTIEVNTTTKIQTTSRHPFYVEGEGWVIANQLQVGMNLQTMNGMAVITNLWKERTDEVIPVYNFRVSGWSSYFVSEWNVYVHNGEGYTDIMKKLTRAQKRNIETLNNVIENNLKEHDFSGTLRDLQGNPVPHPNGGYWDHKTEMIQSYHALQSVKKGLEGSLRNPNLGSDVRSFLESELNKSSSYINKIEELFHPFGGIQ